MKYPIVNMAHPHDVTARGVGFKLESTDKAYGSMGLSEPCFWLEKLVRDAERYQWIKQQAELESYGGSEYCLPTVNAWDYKPGAQLNEQFASLDEAIDAAMSDES